MTIPQLHSIRRLLLGILAIIEDELIARGALTCRSVEKRAFTNTGSSRQ